MAGIAINLFGSYPCHFCILLASPPEEKITNNIANAFGQGNPYVSQSNVDPVRIQTSRSSFIRYVLFELKIECIDRSGSGASIGVQTIRVKFK